MEHKQAMVSRSLRLHKDTLAVLQEQADQQGLGITVYIRTVLESLVSNIKEEKMAEALLAWETDLLSEEGFDA